MSQMPVDFGRSDNPWKPLIRDPWIALSWLIFLFTGLLAVLVVVGVENGRRKQAAFTPATIESSSDRGPSLQTIPAERPFPTGRAFGWFLAIGYIFWSLYFGCAACWRLALGMTGEGFSIWAISGCLYLLSFGWLFFFGTLFYAWFGGGIYQFCRRWWLLAHGEQPPFLGPPTPMNAVQTRLARLDDLLRRGLITRDEYDRQRYQTLGSL